MTDGYRLTPLAEVLFGIRDQATTSPHCARCTPRHAQYPHRDHETAEHDAWLGQELNREGEQG